jgi:dTDP-4-amino-4,6-dideoxygalactose transaminase
MVNKKIIVPATKPYFSKKDINYVNKNFKSIMSGKSFLSMGKYSLEFEKNYAKFIGTKYAVACNSGTSALEIICRSLNISKKEIIVPSNTFIASVNAILNSGCKPVFADCGDDMCLSYENIKKKITKNTKAVMLVHIGGILTKDIFKIKALCEKKKLFLIEDAAQAHGSSFNKVKAGAFGIASGFSFFSTKVLTTGEGGMITTNKLSLVKKMRSIREFGKVKKGIFTNYHTQIGYNWRLQEVNALMGISQLKNIKKFIKGRQKIAMFYDKHFSSLRGIKIISQKNKNEHNYFKYIIILKKYSRIKFHNYLINNGVQPSGYVYELPLHKQPVFKKYKNLKLPNTEFYCSKHICLPIFYGMKIKQAQYVVDVVRNIIIN